MRNQYAGTCYRCGKTVSPGEGHFERHAGGWRTQHASCAIRFRGMTPDAVQQRLEQDRRAREGQQ